MSKSLGNYVAVEDSPNEMFGKLMSLSDELMWKYWLLLTDRTQEEIDGLRKQVAEGDRHPMDVKKELARILVDEFHAEGDGAGAQEEFERVFSSRNLPTDIPEVEVAAGAPEILVSKVLVQAGLASSNGEARRLMGQGGVKVHGEPVTDSRATLAAGDSEVLIQVGKRRIARVTVV
jgi:tyrosyl-tRNA synthetase